MSATPEPEDDNQRITLRIPRDLHAKLMAAGARRTRTMNAEIILRLEESFQTPPPGNTSVFVTVFASKPDPAIEDSLRDADNLIRTGRWSEAAKILESLGRMEIRTSEFAAKPKE